MKRIYEQLAYTDRPIRERYWDTTLPGPLTPHPTLAGDLRCEFAVIGGGYTGLSAALSLADAGGDVVVLDENMPGWGASGRNGGLVSAGSSKLSDDQIERRYGAEEARSYFDAELASVSHVEELLDRLDLDVDRHSRGYTSVAHSARAVDSLREYGETYVRRYGMRYRFLHRQDMVSEGLNSPDFHAAVHLPVGFALNPLKFLSGMNAAAQSAGARLFSHSPVVSVKAGNDGYVLSTPSGQVRSRKLLIATNGYSSDNLPDAFAGRYLPVQSNILVSRPLTRNELETQGWTSRQMLVDTRTLLHYFRLLPDNRMLLGLRGSVRVSENNMVRTRARARADFDRMFPEWQHVETPFFWSGLICMTRPLIPFAGAVPGMENTFAAFGYHGSGVSMGPYAGALIADLALGRRCRSHPTLMQGFPRRFELGRWRRHSLDLAFFLYNITDRI